MRTYLGKVVHARSASMLAPRRLSTVVKSPMQGLMQNCQLLVSNIVEYAGKTHGDVEVVSRKVENPDRFHRYTYKDVNMRSKKLANALTKFGIGIGDRVATVAWNGYRHLELYYGVSGQGAVLHTVNPRLQPEQLAYVMNHAEDKIVFVEVTFFPFVEKMLPLLKTVKGVVVMTDKRHMPQTDLPNVFCYEDFIAGESTEFNWPNLDENAAASICYTSGTTGRPKGVVYSHRSTVLHAMSAGNVNVFSIGCKDVVLPVVAMFHVNAWGIPYAAPMAGAKLVLPGPALDAPRLHAQLFHEGVTMTAGVPLIYTALLQHMKEMDEKLPKLERIYSGGAASAPSLIEGWQKVGIKCMPAWGMTEMSPLGVVNYPGPSTEKDKLYCQGRENFGVELKIVDGSGKEQPRDGVTRGELRCRGPWVASAYFRNDEKLLDDDGFMSTGDMSVITPDGYMKIVDRVKDVIKSGGEWISTIDVENVAVAHPTVALAAVIGVPHPKWDERPLLIITVKPGAQFDKENLLNFMAEKLVRSLYVPDDVVVVDTMPVGGTGKIVKKDMKVQYKDHYANKKDTN